MLRLYVLISQIYLSSLIELVPFLFYKNASKSTRHCKAYIFKWRLNQQRKVNMITTSSVKLYLKLLANDSVHMK